MEREIRGYFDLDVAVLGLRQHVYCIQMRSVR